MLPLGFVPNKQIFSLVRKNDSERERERARALERTVSNNQRLRSDRQGSVRERGRRMGDGGIRGERRKRRSSKRRVQEWIRQTA